MSSWTWGGGGGLCVRVRYVRGVFVKNLPGQMRHCGSLLSHERSHNPDKETRVEGRGGGG